MNANQVVIVMDRAEAEETADALGFAQGNGYDSPVNGSAQMVMAAALDRDPAELETRIARALHFNNPGWGEWDQMSDENQAIFRSDARAVLQALQEGTEK